MVYCNLKQKNDSSAVYLFGTSLNDITGEVEFSTALTTPQISKHPKTAETSATMLTKIAIKYKEKFSRGEFPEKLCYER